MKKVSIISACTDLGLKIDGAELGAQVLTNDLKSSNISHNYVLKGNKKDEESNSSSDSNDINSFVSKFDDLLLDMHEIHFEENMNGEEKDAYYKKMHNLVLFSYKHLHIYFSIFWVFYYTYPRIIKTTI